MTSGGADVFISYKRRLRARVEIIAQRLRDRGLTVWYDASLGAGSSFSEEISREIRAARCVLVLWSPDAFGHGGDTSGWVVGEAMIGRERGVLVPAMLEKTSLDPPWNTYHTVDLSSWSPRSDPSSKGGREWSDLVVAVERKCGRTQPLEDRKIEAPAVRTPGVRWTDRVPTVPRAALLGGTLAVVLALSAWSFRENLFPSNNAAKGPPNVSGFDNLNVSRSSDGKPVQPRENAPGASPVNAPPERANASQAAEKTEETPAFDRAVYDRSTLQIATSLGKLHYFRVMCVGKSDQSWRQFMAALLDREGGSARTDLVDRFNEGYRATEVAHTLCTQAAMDAQAAEKDRLKESANAVRAQWALRGAPGGATKVLEMTSFYTGLWEAAGGTTK